MKAPKKYNTILLNMSKKSISCCDLNKMKNINKSSYYFLISNKSSVTIESDSVYFSFYSLSEQEEENTLKMQMNRLNHFVSTNI